MPESRANGANLSRKEQQIEWAGWPGIQKYAADNWRYNFT